MRPALLLIILLLPLPALAMDEFEAHDLYVRCFHEQAQKLMPDWCHKADQLSIFAHEGCRKEATVLQRAAKIRTPDKALQNAQASAKLDMFDMLRAYKASPGCNR